MLQLLRIPHVYVCMCLDVCVFVHVAPPIATLWLGSLGPLLRATPTGDPQEHPPPPVEEVLIITYKSSTNPLLTEATI